MGIKGLPWAKNQRIWRKFRPAKGSERVDLRGWSGAGAGVLGEAPFAAQKPSLAQAPVSDDRQFSLEIDQ